MLELRFVGFRKLRFSVSLWRYFFKDIVFLNFEKVFVLLWYYFFKDIMFLNFEKVFEKIGKNRSILGKLLDILVVTLGRRFIL